METVKNIVSGFMEKLWSVVQRKNLASEFAIFSNGHLMICVDRICVTLTPAEIRSLEKFMATNKGFKK